MDRVKGNQRLKDIEGIGYDQLSYILLCYLCKGHFESCGFILLYVRDRIKVVW